MKYIFIRTLILYPFLIAVLSCGKDQDSPFPGGQSRLEGALFYSSPTEGVKRIDLASGQVSTVLPDDVDRHDWDVSADGQWVIQSSNAPGTDYDANLYTISQLSNGQTLHQFRYYPADGDYTSPVFGPDKNQIAVVPTYDEGIVVMDLDGHVTHRLNTFNGYKLRQYIMAWMPDQSFLFAVGNDLYRSNTAYTQANRIASIPFALWGEPHVSPDGTKIAFAANGHIWLMNADGTNQVQVTQSSGEETYPTFSPDGKNLLIGCDFISSIGSPAGVVSDGVWRLCVIPADGQQYNVDEGADSRVTRIVLKGKDKAESCDGTMVWR